MGRVLLACPRDRHARSPAGYERTMSQRDERDAEHEDQDAEPTNRAPSGERPSESDESADMSDDRGQDV